jgi:hypothetical protein
MHMVALTALAIDPCGFDHRKRSKFPELDDHTAFVDRVVLQTMQLC